MKTESSPARHRRKRREAALLPDVETLRRGDLEIGSGVGVEKGSSAGKKKPKGLKKRKRAKKPRQRSWTPEEVLAGMRPEEIEEIQALLGREQSAADLHLASGLSRSFLSELENDLSSPTEEVILELEAALGMADGRLMGLVRRRWVLGERRERGGGGKGDQRAAGGAGAGDPPRAEAARASGCASRLDFQHGKLNLPDGKLSLPDGKLNLSDDKLNLSDDKLNLSDGKLNLSDGKLNLPDDKLNLSDDKLSLQHGKLNLSDDKLSLQHDKLNLPHD